MRTSSLVVSLSLSLALALSVAGCSRPRDWHIVMPKQVASIPTDSFYAIPVRISAGGRKPGPVDDIEARCADPAICEARVVNSEVHVLGRHPGSTTVLVDAKNTVYNDTEHHTIAISVSAPPPRSTVELGAPVPTGGDLVHRVAGADVAHCSLRTDGFEADIAGSDRPDVHVYSCSTYVDVDHERRYRACDGALCTPEDSYLLCTQEQTGAVAGDVVIEMENGQLTAKTIEGTLAPGVCAPRG